MNFSTADIESVAASVETAARGVVAAYQGARRQTAEVVSPLMLREALQQFVEVARRIDADRQAQAAGARADAPLASQDITELGDYGLSLLHDLSQWAAQLQCLDAKRDLDALAVPLALWVARRGGCVNTLEPVVNALAVLANSTSDPQRLTELCEVMGEIAEAAAPAIRQDLDRGNPGRPWRILLLNRAIVATRTHSPEVMEQVFPQLVQALPEDAPAFFQEGMRQMDALDYPPAVRAVMETFFRAHSGKSLH